jgi:hypothetical protein
MPKLRDLRSFLDQRDDNLVRHHFAGEAAAWDGGGEATGADRATVVKAFARGAAIAAGGALSVGRSSAPWASSKASTLLAR